MNYGKCLTHAPGAQCSNHRATEPQLLLLFLFHLASGWLSQSESRPLVFKGSSHEPAYSASGRAASCAQTLMHRLGRVSDSPRPKLVSLFLRAAGFVPCRRGLYASRRGCTIVRAESPAMPEFPDTEFLLSLLGVSRNVNSRYQTCDLNTGLYEELSITLSQPHARDWMQNT